MYYDDEPVGLKPVVNIDDFAPIALLSPEDQERFKGTKKVDANDMAATLGSKAFLLAVQEAITGAPVVFRSQTRIISLRDLRAENPRLRDPVIDGLLRQGEIMNIIASPKMGKTWMSLDLALTVIQGAAWFKTFQTRCGRVLIIDNELHKETIAFRTELASQSDVRKIDLDYVDDMIDYIPLRGKLVDLDSLAEELKYVRPRDYSLIILDAFYKMMPPRTDENDNGQMTNLYNKLDLYAETTQSSIVLIHHTTKGLQSGKKVTDVGAGAGVQSRATDTHLVLRPHKDFKAHGTIVLDAAVRSFRQPKGLCLRPKFPTWEIDPEANPDELEDAQERTENAKAREQRGADKERLLAAIIKPMTIAQIVGLATEMRMGIGYGTIHATVKKDWEINHRVRVVRQQSGKSPALYINNLVKADPSDNNNVYDQKPDVIAAAEIIQVEENPFPEDVNDLKE